MHATSPTSRNILCCCMILLLALCSSAGAVIFNVDDTADLVDEDTTDGLCETFFTTCSLRAAIQQANALTGPGTDTINVPVGIYKLSLPRVGLDTPLTGDLDITDDLDIVGAGPGKTIIDARGLVLHDHQRQRLQGSQWRSGHLEGERSPHPEKRLRSSRRWHLRGRTRSGCGVVHRSPVTLQQGAFWRDRL